MAKSFFSFNSINLRGKADHNNNRHKQMKCHAHVSVQQTAQTQRFIEQVEDTVEIISLAGKMFQKKDHDPAWVNLLCDNAVLSLNLLTKSCEEMDIANNKEAIELGLGRAIKKFADLESENIEVYKLVDPHRKFMIAALNGQKNLKFQEQRVEAGAVDLFENNASDINAAFGFIAKNQYKFNKRQESFNNAETSQKLAKAHHTQLNECRNNKKYKKKTKNKTKYNKPNVSDLYWTKSGKESQFRNKFAEEQKEQEERDMMVDLMGAEESAYDRLTDGYRYDGNAVLLLSKQNTYTYDDGIIRKTFKKPVPCKMVEASTKNPQNMIEIRLCYPYNKSTNDFAANMLSLDQEEVEEYEKEHIKKHGKLGDEHHEHLSIKEQEFKKQQIEEQQLDLEDSNDVDMDGTGRYNM